MSSCLFTVSSDYFTHKTIKQIEELIGHWQTTIDAGPDNLFGGKDHIAGCHYNIEAAKQELAYREAKTTAHHVHYRIQHELREGSPNLKRALMDASKYGVGYVRFTDKSPNKWFEYVTESELKEEFKNGKS